MTMPTAQARVAAGAGAATAVTAKTPGILYSLDARDGRIVKRGHAYRLFLPARSAVTWFTNRPERRAGFLSLRSLAAIWKASGFVKDPPNAALIVTQRAGDRTHVVELTKPRAKKKRVSFRLTESRSQREAGYAHRDRVKPGRYARVRMFIDDTALSPCPGTYYSPKSTATGPVLQQCLLAPGKSLATYEQAGGTRNPTVVTACAVGGTYNGSTNLVSVVRAGTWLPYAPAPVVRGCQVTADYTQEGWMASWGFDPYNAPMPDSGTICPDPPGGSNYVSMTNPATSAYTLRVTVQQNSSLVCQNYVTEIYP